MILFFILLLPLVSIITLSISKNINVIKFNPIITMGISLGIIIYFIFDQQIASNGNFDNLYINLYTLIPAFDVNMSFNIDRISILLLILSHLTIITAFFSTLNFNPISDSYEQKLIRHKQINVLISLISIGINGLIISNNLFVFFLFYEIAAIPIFLMISTFGYNLKREVSGPFTAILKFFNVGSKEYGSYKITIYLFVASILIFFGLAILGISSGCLRISSGLLGISQGCLRISKDFLWIS